MKAEMCSVWTELREPPFLLAAVRVCFASITITWVRHLRAKRKKHQRMFSVVWEREKKREERGRWKKKVQTQTLSSPEFDRKFRIEPLAISEKGAWYVQSRKVALLPYHTCSFSSALYNLPSRVLMPNAPLSSSFPFHPPPKKVVEVWAARKLVSQFFLPYYVDNQAEMSQH